MARQTGYVIRIDGFVPVDKTSLASQKAAIDALTAAEGGDLAGLLAVMEKTGLRHTFASRPTPEPVAPSGKPDTSGAPPKKPA